MKKLIQYIPDFKCTSNSFKYAIVAEAPGAVEMQTGIPFTGPEGYYMNKLFKEAGVDRYAVPITNTVHVQPFKNVYGSLPKDEIEFGREQLRKDLIAWKKQGLTTVIALGAKAFEMLTGLSGITKYRGTAVPCSLVEGLKVYSTFHAGYLIRGNGKYEPVVVNDLAKAISDCETSKIFYPRRDVEIIKSPFEAIALLEKFTDFNDLLIIDIETAGKIMTAYGMAFEEDHAFVLTKEILKLPSVLRAIGKMAKSSTPKGFHNALFDCLHGAYYYRILYKNIACDTMLKQHAAYPTLPKSLAFCSSVYTLEPYWKDEGREGKALNADKEIKKVYGNIDWEKFYIYCGKDCCLTKEIDPKIGEELKSWGTEKVYDFDMKLIRPCLSAMLRGMDVDPYAVEEFADKNERAIDILERIKEETIGPVNVNSHVQLKKLIYDNWKMPLQKKQGKPTSDGNAIDYLSTFPTPYSQRLQLISKLKEYKTMSKFYKLKVNEDGRVRYALKIHGTYTGRLSSSASIFGTGDNYQNQPSEVRIFYISDPGKILIERDLSQAEARVVAALCKDFEWLHAFDERDLHSETAAFLFGIPIEKVKRKTHRQTAKKIAHGTHYLLGVKLMSTLLKASKSEASRLMSGYHKLHPSLEEWHKAVRKQLEKTKLFETPFGRKIQFFGPISEDTIRKATAAVPQSTSVSYMNQSIIRCHDEVPEADFLLQVHDSSLDSVDDDLNTIYKVMKQMKEITEQEIDVFGIKLVIPCDFKIGYCWGKLQEVKTLDDVERIYDSVQEQKALIEERRSKREEQRYISKWIN